VHSLSRRTVWTVGIAVVALSISPLWTAAAAAEDAPGHEIFLAMKCDMCHSVSSVGIEARTKSEKMKGPDLVNVASRHDAAWVKKFLLREVQLDDADHKKEFKGSDEELQALVDWLMEQKSG